MTKKENNFNADLFKDADLAFKIYDADKPNHPSRLFDGVASGIRNWDDIKYPIFLDYQIDLFDEKWVPQEIPMERDKRDYLAMTREEQQVFNYVSGKLNWLDSIASDIVTLLHFLATDPSLRSVLGLISSFETMHNQSYEYLTSSVLGHQDKMQAFDEVRKIPELNKRNMLIIDKLENMKNLIVKSIVIDLETGERERLTLEENQILFEGLLAYQVLEGLYFSGGFVYFHSLARDHRMISSNKMITLIKADENQHSEIFGAIIQMLMGEVPELNTTANKEYAINYIKEAVELEKEWSSWLYEGIDTMTVSEYHDYAEYLANLIGRNAGMGEPYPDNLQIKSQWIVTYGQKTNEEGSGIRVKNDFLQQQDINYVQASENDFDL